MHIQSATNVCRTINESRDDNSQLTQDYCSTIIVMLHYFLPLICIFDLNNDLAKSITELCILLIIVIIHIDIVLQLMLKRSIENSKKFFIKGSFMVSLKIFCTSVDRIQMIDQDIWCSLSIRLPKTPKKENSSLQSMLKASTCSVMSGHIT